MTPLYNVGDILIFPNNSTVTIQQVITNSDGSFSYILLDNRLKWIMGKYTEESLGEARKI